MVTHFNKSLLTLIAASVMCAPMIFAEKQAQDTKDPKISFAEIGEMLDGAATSAATTISDAATSATEGLSSLLDQNQDGKVDEEDLAALAAAAKDLQNQNFKHTRFVFDCIKFAYQQSPYGTPIALLTAAALIAGGSYKAHEAHPDYTKKTGMGLGTILALALIADYIKTQADKGPVVAPTTDTTTTPAQS